MDLFTLAGVDEWGGDLREQIYREAARVPGLHYVPDFVTPDEEIILIERIDTMPWSHEYSRRRQHYGYAYHTSMEARVTVLPLLDWLSELAVKTANCKLQIEPERIFLEPPKTALINEYLPGQGISPHVDLGDQNNTVVSLSLGSTCVMEFSPGLGADTRRDETVSVLLEPRSMVVLKDEVRQAWKHGISKRLSDRFHGRAFKRGRRVSITFRGV